MFILLFSWPVIPVIVGVTGTEAAAVCSFWSWLSCFIFLDDLLLYLVPRGVPYFLCYDEFWSGGTCEGFSWCTVWWFACVMGNLMSLTLLQLDGKCCTNLFLYSFGFTRWAMVGDFCAKLALGVTESLLIYFCYTDGSLLCVTGWIRMFTEHEELEVHRVNI